MCVGGMVDCRVVVESGALSYLLAALSSRVDEVRMAATHCLSRFSAHLRVSTCREKPQVSLERECSTSGVFVTFSAVISSAEDSEKHS